MSSFYNRIAHCQTVNGEQFEHTITMIFKHQQNVFVKPIMIKDQFYFDVLITSVILPLSSSDLALVG